MSPETKKILKYFGILFAVIVVGIIIWLIARGGGHTITPCNFDSDCPKVDKSKPYCRSTCKGWACSKYPNPDSKNKNKSECSWLYADGRGATPNAPNALFRCGSPGATIHNSQCVEYGNSTHVCLEDYLPDPWNEQLGKVDGKGNAYPSNPTYIEQKDVPYDPKAKTCCHAAAPAYQPSSGCP